MLPSEYKESIKRYNADAMNFDNADGLYNSYVGENYVGQDADGGMGVADGGAAHIETGDDVYTIVVTNTNTSGAAINAIIFGADLYTGATQPNAGVTVIVDESSHSQVRSESQRSPFWINGLKYITTTTTQMTSQILTFTTQSSAGAVNSVPFRPLTFRTAFQQISTQIDAINTKFLVNGSFYITVPTIANEIITIICKIGGRFSSSGALKGGSAFKVANQAKLPGGFIVTQ